MSDKNTPAEGLDELERLLNAAEVTAPYPWAVKPVERTPFGNESSHLVDRDGSWVASFDGHDEQELAAAAVNALPDLIQQARDAQQWRDRALAAEGRVARYEGAHWSEMSDEDMGRAFKAFATTVTVWSGSEWRDEGERRLGLMMLGLKEAARMAFESNAETLTTTFNGFTVKGDPAGDWTVTVARAALTPEPDHGARTEQKGEG